MTEKHTPTPWKTFLGDSQIGDAQGGGICAMWRVAKECTDEENAEGEANARFIVKACNMHAELVEALRRIADETHPALVMERDDKRAYRVVIGLVNELLKATKEG